MNQRDISLAHPRLQRAWAYVLANWRTRFPGAPVPFLTQVFRPSSVQAAYYAQGRKGLHEVNELRRAANLSEISGQENLNIITKSPVGKSKHERTPSEAIDVAFIKKGTKSELDWDMSLFGKVHELLKEADPGIKWGKYFQKVDGPHFEI